MADAVSHGRRGIFAGQHFLIGFPDLWSGDFKDAGILSGKGCFPVFAQGAAAQGPRALKTLLPEIFQPLGDCRAHGGRDAGVVHQGDHFPGQLRQALPVIQLDLGQKFIQPVSEIIVLQKMTEGTGGDHQAPGSRQFGFLQQPA